MAGKIPPGATDDRVILVTENYGGNLHQAATTISYMGLAAHVVTMDYNGGNHTVAVFRMTKAEYDAFCKAGVFHA